MRSFIIYPLLCTTVLAIAEFSAGLITPPADPVELAKIDPSKALDLIRRIKTASGDVAS